MDLEKRVQRLQGNFQPGLEGKGSFGYGTFLPMVDGASKISSKRSREQPSQTTNSQVSNSQVRNNQPSHTSVAPDPTIDDMASQIPKSSTETSSPSKIIQVMTIPLGPLLSPFVSVPSAIEDPVIEHTSTVQQEVKPEQQLEPQMETVVQQTEPQQDQVVQPQPEVSLEKIEEPTPEKGQLDSSQVHSKGPESDTQLPLPKQENKDIEKPLKAPKEKKEPENGVSTKSQTPEMQHSKEKKEKSVLDSSTSNEATKDRKSKLDKSRTDDKKTKEREESKEKKEKKLKDSQRSKEKKKEKEVDKKKDKREQTRTRSTSRSSSRSRSRERDRGRNYDRDRDYKEKRRRRSYSYSSDNGNSSSPARSRYSSSDSERDYDRKRRRKGKSRSRSRDRKDRDKDRKDRSDRSKSKKRKRESRDRGTTKAEDSRKSKSAITEILITETTNLSVTSAKDASAIAEECKKNATKLKHVADKLSDKSQAGEIYFQSGLQFLACAHAYEEGSMHDKAVMMYQQTGTFFESIAKMYSHDEKFKVLVSMCCKCVAVALSRRFILDPSRLRQLHSDLSLIGSTSGTNNTVPNSPPSSTQGNNLDPSPPQPPVSTSPSLPPANTERSSTSSSSTQSQPTVRLKGEKQQNLFDMIKCFEMWGRAEKNLAIQHHSMTNVKELIQSLTQYAKTNLATSSTTDV